MSAKISRDQGLLREIVALVTVMGELFVVESFLHAQSVSQDAVNTYKSGGIMDIVVGGFGELRNAACLGIEQLILKAGGNASNDSDDAALLSRGRLLADVPSPTWMELHTAADGSQVLYAVLEDTNEIASFASRGGRLIAACGAVPRTHAGSCRHSCGVCVRRRRSGSPHHRRLRRRVRLRASGNGIRVILEVAQMLRGEGHGPLPKPDQAASLAFVPWNALQGERGCRGSQRGHSWVGVCGAAWFRTHRDVVVGWQAAYPA